VARAQRRSRSEPTFLAPADNEAAEVGDAAPPGTVIAGPDELLSVALTDDHSGVRAEFGLADAAAARLADFSRDNVGRSFLVIVDGVVVSAPTVSAPVNTGPVVITSPDVGLLRRLAAFVNGGPLPVALEVSSD
jgi:preprotein translocase subunit SecD